MREVRGRPVQRCRRVGSLLRCCLRRGLGWPARCRIRLLKVAIGAYEKAQGDGNSLFQFLLNIINVTNSKNHIYPNPTNGKINIELNDKSIKSFVIVNSLGQIIIEKKVSNYRILEDLSNQPKGIYYLSLLGNEKNQIKQIIIL